MTKQQINKMVKFAKYKKTMIVLSTIMAIGTSILVSCNKNADELTPHINDRLKNSPQRRLKLNSEERELFAKTLAKKLGENKNAFSELNDAIHAVTEYGLDENLKMFDILNTEESVFLESPNQVRILRSILNDCNILDEYEFNSSDYYSDLQFYWPYHDKWDKETTPVICFAPEDDTTKTVTGFLYENGNIIPITLNEEIVDKLLLPVIVINKSEISYVEYPNFKLGEWQKNGKIWCKPFPVIHPVNPVPVDPTSNNLVYDAESISLTSSGAQWDNWWAGGSEFELTTVYTRDATNLEVTTTAVVEFSRGEIDNEVTKNFYARLHNDWQSGLGDIYICLIEQDDWGISTDQIDISLDVAGNTLSTSINIGSTDDIIYSAPVARSNYFYRCNFENGVLGLGGEKLNCRLRVYESYE